jgi:hypothetical protein
MNTSMTASKCLPVFLIALVGSALCFPSQSHSARQSRCVEREIESLAGQILTLVRERKSTEFLEFVGKAGLHLNPDSGKLTRAEVVEQFHSKAGIYCALFDSECLRREAAVAGATETADLHSLREIFLTSTSVSTKTFLSSEHGRDIVQVSFIITGGVAAKPTVPDRFDFFLARRKSGWAITEMPWP